MLDTIPCCTLSYSRFGNFCKFIMFQYVSVCLSICYSVLFLPANFVLFILFLVGLTSESRILRVNKESRKLKIDSVLQISLIHEYTLVSFAKMSLE